MALAPQIIPSYPAIIVMSGFPIIVPSVNRKNSMRARGWFTVTGDSSEAVILSEPEVVTEVQLEKFRDGFLYNTVIPEDELSQVDLTNPFGKFFELTENSPN